MLKEYNTTYSTFRICEVSNITVLPNVNAINANTGVIFSTVNFGNISGGIRNSVPNITPSGLVSIPNSNMRGLCVNMGNGQSMFAIHGYMYNSLDNRIKISKEGETSLFSNNYFINLLNDALKIEYSKDNPQECQLPIGEATQQAFKIILNEIINNLKPYINQQIVAVYNSHVHSLLTITLPEQTGTVTSGAGSGGTVSIPGATLTVVPTPTSTPTPTMTNYTETNDIDTAYTYMNGNKLLISEIGENTI